MTIRVSPFGMDECCICDGPTTHTIPAESGEYLPYCAKCAAIVKREFPDVRVLLYAPRRPSVSAS